jgi:hypothetical protein
MDSQGLRAGSFFFVALRISNIWKHPALRSVTKDESRLDDREAHVRRSATCRNTINAGTRYVDCTKKARNLGWQRNLAVLQQLRIQGLINSRRQISSGRRSASRARAVG